MSENKNSGEVEKKIRAIFASPQVAALATVTGEGKPWVRYVTVRLSDGMMLRFVTDAGSRKVAHIRGLPEVHLVCGSLQPPEDSAYLQIAGRAEVSGDPEEKRSLWNEELRRYFKGPDDPNYVVVRVRPSLIEYYDPHNLTPQIWTPK